MEEKKPEKEKFTYLYICPSCGRTAQATKKSRLVCGECNEELVLKTCNSK